MVTERVVVRWIAYLQRIAALYARGRLSACGPIQADQMPPEIRDLAETLEDMADAIVGRDASLRDSLAQKDALMREIHHRVKNNLQVISSLLNMQQRALTDPAARAAMSDTRQRITALALIYRALYQGPDLKRVDLRPFLEELTAQLVAGEMHARPAGAHRAVGRRPGHRSRPPGAAGPVRRRGDHQRPEARLRRPRRHADRDLPGARRGGRAGDLRRRRSRARTPWPAPASAAP